jgi:hypothetical protein
VRAFAVAEELGYDLAPAACLPAVVAAATLTQAGSVVQRKTWLARIVDGSLLAGVIVGNSMASR